GEVPGGPAEGPRSNPDPAEPGAVVGHVLRDQQGLWREVISLADYVAGALRTAVEALCATRPDLIAEVRAEEEEIDRWEVRIERECLRSLALYDLVASDLRRVITAMRVSHELEGLADLAENLAKRGRKLARDPLAADYLPELRSLAEESVGLVNQSLEALRTVDAEL